MIVRLLALSMRVFLATVAVNIMMPDGSIMERSLASLALSLMAGIKED